MRVSVFPHVRAALLAVLFLLMSAAVAAPPRFVYRGSVVPPDQAFQNGFPNPGHNEDLIAHITGGSCIRRETVFVPTSASESVAHGYALGQIRIDPDMEAYVYRIRAAGNFYSADASLREAHRRTGDPRYTELADYFQDEQEWLAYRGVQANQVESVTVYRRNPQTRLIEAVSMSRNPNYVAAQTHGNDQPFPISQPPSDRRWISPSYTSTHASACLACFSSEADMRRKRSTDFKQCEVFEVDSDTPLTTVIDPITHRRVQRYVPWRSWRRTHKYATYSSPVDCAITPGGKGGDHLTVDCRQLRGAESFSVHTGAGGSKHVWVDTRFDNGVVARKWVVTSRDLPVKGTSYTLASYKYPIYAVFSGFHTSWWSTIEVLPVYPKLPASSAAICSYKDAGYSNQLGCLPGHDRLARLHGPTNDAISSIRASADQRYQVCEHFDFEGRCFILSGNTDTHTLNSIGMNDKISSIRACKKPKPNVSKPFPNNRGLIGEVYVDDNAHTGKREFYKLKASTYGGFPLRTPGTTSHWEHLPDYDEC